MSLPPLVAPADGLSPAELARYARQVTIPGLGLEGQRRLKNARVLVVGADSFATRYLVNDACVLLGKPCAWGSILRFDGQTTVFWADPPAGSGVEGVQYRDVFPVPPAHGSVPTCAEVGVLGVLCAAIGSVMANEAVKLITGIGQPLLGRLLTFDALTTRWREIPVRPDPRRAPSTTWSRSLAPGSCPGESFSTARRSRGSTAADR